MDDHIWIYGGFYSHGGTPKWIVSNGKSDEHGWKLGVPSFWEASICGQVSQNWGTPKNPPAFTVKSDKSFGGSKTYCYIYCYHILGEQTAINHVWLWDTTWDTTWVPSRSQTFDTPSLRHWIRFLAMPRKHFSEIVLEKAQHMAGKGPKKKLKTLEMTGKTIIESRIMCIPEGLVWNGRIGSIDCYSLV